MEALDHDGAYKAIYGHPFMVEELVRWRASLVAGGTALVEALDFNALTRAQEQAVAGGRRRSGDMVWRAPLTDRARDDPASWAHLVLLLEFQSAVDHLMALRCRQYVDNFHLEAWRGRRFGKEDRLPPVLVFVLHNGAGPWSAARRVIDLVTPGASPPVDDLSPSSPLLAGDGYLLVDSSAVGSDDLAADNAAALLASLEQPSPEVVPERLMRLFRRVGGPRFSELRALLLDWTRRVLRRRLGLDLGEANMADLDRMNEADELEEYWAARRREWADAYRAEGRAQGRAEALEAERALLRRQAERRFGPEAAEPLAAFLEDLQDTESLAEAGDWIVDCATAAELVSRVVAAR